MEIFCIALQNSRRCVPILHGHHRGNAERQIQDIIQHHHTVEHWSTSVLRTHYVSHTTLLASLLPKHCYSGPHLSRYQLDLPVFPENSSKPGNSCIPHSVSSSSLWNPSLLPTPPPPSLPHTHPCHTPLHLGQGIHYQDMAISLNVLSCTYTEIIISLVCDLIAGCCGIANPFV